MWTPIVMLWNSSIKKGVHILLFKKKILKTGQNWQNSEENLHSLTRTIWQAHRPNACDPVRINAMRKSTRFEFLKTSTEDSNQNFDCLDEINMLYKIAIYRGYQCYVTTAMFTAEVFDLMHKITLITILAYTQNFSCYLLKIADMIAVHKSTVHHSQAPPDIYFVLCDRGQFRQDGLPRRLHTVKYAVQKRFV